MLYPPSNLLSINYKGLLVVVGFLVGLFVGRLVGGENGIAVGV